MQAEERNTPDGGILANTGELFSPRCVCILERHRKERKHNNEEMDDNGPGGPDADELADCLRRQ